MCVASESDKGLRRTKLGLESSGPLSPCETEETMTLCDVVRSPIVVGDNLVTSSAFVSFRLLDGQ